jgi:hypothetical protein
MPEGPYKATPGHRADEWLVTMSDGASLMFTTAGIAEANAQRLNAAWAEGYAAAETDAGKVVPLRPVASAVNLTDDVMKLANSAANLATVAQKACAAGQVAGDAGFTIGVAAAHLGIALVPFVAAEAALTEAAKQEKPS